MDKKFTLIFGLLFAYLLGQGQICMPSSGGYYKINFNFDGDGNTLERGQIINTSTYAAHGIHFQSLAGVSHPLVVFDTGNPVLGAVDQNDGDPDMGSPNEDCPGGGPGIGSGGAPGTPGENCTFLGNVLIIEENWTDNNGDNRDDVPDDLGGGGQIKIMFDNPTTLGKIGFLDDIDVTIIVTHSDFSSESFMYNGPGNNAYGEWDINADPSNNARDIVELTFNLTGSGGITFIETCNDLLLPIKLVSFEALEASGKVEVQWATATESNNDLFVIERSHDGLTFNEIGRISGAGNSQEVTNYDWIDPNPYQGSNFYRLKQIDFDGHFSYSGIEMVELDISYEINVYPTVTDGTIKIELKPEIGINTFVRLMDLRGQYIWIKELNDHKTDIDISDLPAGPYFIFIQQGDKLYSRRIMKM